MYKTRLFLLQMQENTEQTNKQINETRARVSNGHWMCLVLMRTSGERNRESEIDREKDREGD